MYDYSKLIGRISEKRLTREALASRIGITDGALRDKLKGRTQFKQNEIVQIIDVLDLKPKDIASYFFAS